MFHSEFLVNVHGGPGMALILLGKGNLRSEAQACMHVWTIAPCAAFVTAHNLQALKCLSSTTVWYELVECVRFFLPSLRLTGIEVIPAYLT